MATSSLPRFMASTIQWPKKASELHTTGFVPPDDDALGRHPVGVVLVTRLAELAHVGHPLVAHDHVAERRAGQHARVGRTGSTA